MLFTPVHQTGDLFYEIKTCEKVIAGDLALKWRGAKTPRLKSVGCHERHLSVACCAPIKLCTSFCEEQGCQRRGNLDVVTSRGPVRSENANRRHNSPRTGKQEPIWNTDHCKLTHTLTHTHTHKHTHTLCSPEMNEPLQPGMDRRLAFRINTSV